MKILKLLLSGYVLGLKMLAVILLWMVGPFLSLTVIFTVITYASLGYYWSLLLLVLFPFFLGFWWLSWNYIIDVMVG